MLQAFAPEQRPEAAGPGHPVRVGLADEPNPLPAPLICADDRVEEVAALSEFGARYPWQPRGGDQAFQVGQASDSVVIKLVGPGAGCAWQPRGRYHQVFLVTLD